MERASQSGPDRQLLKSTALTIFALAFTTVALWLIAGSLARSDLQFLLNPLDWLASLDDSEAFDTLGNAAEVVAAVLAIAITVVAIIVELAASRYSHLITRLFIREPVNFLVLGLFVITTIQCVWSSAVISSPQTDALVPQAGFAVTMGLVTLSLLALLPYIYYVLTFLSPISVIRRISYGALVAMRKADRRSVESTQRRVQAAIDELQDVSRGAVIQGDRGIAMVGVAALSDLVLDYAKLKGKLPESWFQVAGTVAGDADFIALASSSLRKIEDERIWFETKIFRQLYALMTLCAGQARQVANLIAIETQRIATTLGGADARLLHLCIRTMNSYLRATINARDPRTAYYVMNQYRQLAEHQFSTGNPERALEIAGYFREYGQFAHQMGISFLLEAASYDLVQLVGHALEVDDASVDKLLDVLLELDEEIKEERNEDSLLGVRRSQLILAVTFLQLGQSRRAIRVIDDLKDERLERLERLRVGLETDERADYWELADRGANFAYLQPALRPFLAQVFEQLRR